MTHTPAARRVGSEVLQKAIIVVFRVATLEPMVFTSTVTAATVLRLTDAARPTETTVRMAKTREIWTIVKRVYSEELLILLSSPTRFIGRSGGEQRRPTLTKQEIP
jgi:hypothetical protein